MNENVTRIPDIFGSMVFTEEKMRQRLSPDVYQAWQQCQAQGMRDLGGIFLAFADKEKRCTFFPKN